MDVVDESFNSSILPSWKYQERTYSESHRATSASRSHLYRNNTGRRSLRDRSEKIGQEAGDCSFRTNTIPLDIADEILSPPQRSQPSSASNRISSPISYLNPRNDPDHETARVLRSRNSDRTRISSVQDDMNHGNESGDLDYDVLRKSSERIKSMKKALDESMVKKQFSVSGQPERVPVYYTRHSDLFPSRRTASSNMKLDELSHYSDKENHPYGTSRVKGRTGSNTSRSSVGSRTRGVGRGMDSKDKRLEAFPSRKKSDPVALFHQRQKDWEKVKYLTGTTRRKMDVPEYIQDRKSPFSSWR